MDSSFRRNDEALSSVGFLSINLGLIRNEKLAFVQEATGIWRRIKLRELRAKMSLSRVFGCDRRGNGLN